jgi:tetratricopeptide (TPR) repeat protein
VLVRLSTIRVPILRRDPEYAPVLDERPVPLESIARTLLELAGVEDGLHPDAAPDLDTPPPAIHAETLYPNHNFGWRGLRVREEDGWRLVSGDFDRLYRTDSDPGELEDLSALRPDVVERLRTALDEEWRSRRTLAAELSAASGSADGEPETLSPAEIEALRSLGYASPGAAPDRDPEEAFAEGPDPRVRIQLVDRINQGVTRLDEGAPAGAIELFEEIVAEDPGNRMAWEYLGKARLRAMQPEGARDALARAVELGPSPASVYLDLSMAERTLGDPDAEWRALEGALAADPQSVPTRNRMGKILVDAGRPDEAKPIIEEIIRLRPRAARPHVYMAQIEVRLGNLDEARRHWRIASELGAGTPIGEMATQALERLDESGGRGRRGS